MNASHAVAPLSRLLWKEYRLQRSLWLVMLVLGLLPQILLRFTVGEAVPRASFVWALAGALPFLFAIGSTAILFAGEREERTADWLLNLAVPPKWTLLAKWSFVMIATVALAASLSVSALLLVWSGPGVLATSLSGTPRYVDEMIVFRYMMVFVGLLIWGGLGSLISRRVVIAVPASGFLWLMTFMVPVIWIPFLIGLKYGDPAFGDIQDRVARLIFVLGGLANLVLGWLWCQGKYFDATILDGVNSKIVAWWNRTRGRTTARVRLPDRTEFDSAWRREWQRLIWQERHRDRYHRGLLYMGLVIVFLLAFMGWLYRVDDMPLILPLIVVLPMVMGVMGFRYDGEGLPLRFLSNRGVEARSLWLAKHAVWLPRAIWIPSSVWFVAGVVQSLLPPADLGPAGQQPAWQLLQFSLLHTYPVAFVLLSYGCGHLAAVSFRRTILALVVGFTASLLATLWLVAAVALEVPLWWSMGWLILWIFRATFLAMPSWLIERPLPGRMQRLAAYTAPLILLIAAWGAWRAYEIPGFHPNLLSSAQSFELIDSANLRKEQLGLTTEASVLNDKLVLDRLALLMEGFNREQDFVQGLHRDGPASADPNQPTDPTEAFWYNNGPRLKELLDITSSSHGPSASPRLSFSGVSDAIMPQQILLLEAGRMRTREGRLDEAFRYYIASLRLANFWATDRGLSTRLEAQHQQLVTLDGIVQWASHPDQNGEALRAARQRLQVELELFPSIQQTLVAQCRDELVSLEETIQHGARWDRGQPAWQQFIIDYCRLLPWERVRARRWLEQELLDRDYMVNKGTALLQQPGIDVGRRLDQIEMYRLIHMIVDKSYWQVTTPLAPMEGAGHDQIASMMIDRGAAIRESLLALSLLAWKRDHHRWPETLVESLDDLPSVTVIDPWCGEYFRYNGSVLNQPKADGSPVLVLSTVGPHQLREVPIGTSASRVTELRNWMGDTVASDDRLRLKLEDDRLSFRLPSSARSK